jgi:hypothetical protein
MHEVHFVVVGGARLAAIQRDVPLSLQFLVLCLLLLLCFRLFQVVV